MPLYTYVRRRGYARADAEDLVQGFFALLLQRQDFAGRNAGQGRFRAFLLAALKHYLANARDYASRQKRGGGVALLTLDWAQAERLLENSPDPAPTPDAAFDREWALALLSWVLTRLQREWVAKGRGTAFEAVKVFLTPESAGVSSGEIAGTLGMEEGAVRVLAHRLRRRYRELLKEEIAQTVKDAAMVAEELAALMGAF
jgi:RNA polymerase sigma-70 factor (ECF subfamily)